MANQDIPVSGLQNTNSITTEDLALVTVVDELSATGYTSKHITEGNRARQYLGNFTWQDLQTEAKDIFGAINEAATTGGGGIENFEITFVESLQTCDKTMAQIFAAYDAGKRLILKKCDADVTDLLYETSVTCLQVVNSTRVLIFLDTNENLNFELAIFNESFNAPYFDTFPHPVPSDVVQAYRGTLTAGNTSLTITCGSSNINFEDIVVSTSVFGVNPSNIVIDNSNVLKTVELTFTAQASDVGVCVRVYK